MRDLSQLFLIGGLVGPFYDDLILTYGLTKRQAEVAELVASGMSSKDVAAKLFVVEKCIKFHLTAIYKKLGIKSRSQLIIRGFSFKKEDELEANRISFLPKGA